MTSSFTCSSARPRDGEREERELATRRIASMSDDPASICCRCVGVIFCFSPSFFEEASYRDQNSTSRRATRPLTVLARRVGARRRPGQSVLCAGARRWLWASLAACPWRQPSGGRPSFGAAARRLDAARRCPSWLPVVATRRMCAGARRLAACGLALVVL